MKRLAAVSAALPVTVLPRVTTKQSGSPLTRPVSIGLAEQRHKPGAKRDPEDVVVIVRGETLREDAESREGLRNQLLLQASEVIPHGFGILPADTEE